MCITDRRERKLVHTMFILLNPLSHSAVLTGMVSTAFITCFSAARSVVCCAVYIIQIS